MSELPFRIINAKDRDDWLTLRRTGIGGSDAAAAIGVSRWKSPLELWLEKTGQQEPQDLSDNAAVEWGTRLEDVIADKFKEEHPELRVERKRATLISKAYPHMLANLDRVITAQDGSKGILEIKTAGQYSKDAWEDGVPLEYYSQVSHYLAVTGFDFVYVAVLIGGRDYREYYLGRDEEDIATLISREVEFWGLVETNTIPAIQGKGNESAALTSIYTPDDGEIIPLTKELDEALKDYIYAAHDEKAAKEIKDHAAAKIRAELGTAKGTETELHRIIWVRSQAKTFNKDAFKKDHPDLYEKYIEVKPRDGGLKVKEKK